MVSFKPNDFMELFDYICNKYCKEVGDKLNEYKTTMLKINKCGLDIEYLKNCMRKGLLPNFTRINPPCKSILKSKCTQRYRWQMVDVEFSNKKSNLRKLKKESVRIEQELLWTLTRRDFRLVIDLINTKIRSTANEITNKHNKKLTELELRNGFECLSSIDKESQLVAYNEQVKFSNNIFNLSVNKVLTREEENVLIRGLKFGIKPKRINYYEVLVNFFELMAQRLNKIDIDLSRFDASELKIDPRQEFNQKLKQLAMDYLKYTLINLSKDKSIVIFKADKVDDVVIQDRIDYDNKLLKLLSDETKFKPLNEDPTIKRMTHLNGYINNLKYRVEKGVEVRGIEDEIAKSIVSTGCKPGVLYDLPKVHKKDNPIRPIISAVGTYNYKLAKYLDSLLKPLVNEGKFLLSGTFDLIELIKLNFPKMNLQVVLKTPLTIGNLFTIKDKTRRNLLSKVVYRINCSNCERFYVGKIIRNICKRFEEHTSSSLKNNESKMNDMVKKNDSSVFKHMVDYKHTMDDNWVLLDRASTNEKLLLKEMLHINKLKPQLNVQEDSNLFCLLIGNNKVKNNDIQ